MSVSQNYYLKSAFQFESRARQTDPEVKSNCLELARAYRETALVATHRPRTPADELDLLAERMVGGRK